MPIKKKSKAVVVKEHPRRVPVSTKNPSGRTASTMPGYTHVQILNRADQS